MIISNNNTGDTWESFASKDATEAVATKNLVLTEGETDIHIFTPPNHVSIHWEKARGKNVRVTCPGSSCPLCDIGHQVTRVLRCGAADLTGNRVGPLEISTALWKEIKMLIDAHKDPTKYIIKVKREQINGRTRWAAKHNGTVNLSASMQDLEDKFDQRVLTAVDSAEDIEAKQLDCLQGKNNGYDDSAWDEVKVEEAKSA